MTVRAVVVAFVRPKRVVRFGRVVVAESLASNLPSVQYLLFEPSARASVVVAARLTAKL